MTVVQTDPGLVPLSKTFVSVVLTVDDHGTGSAALREHVRDSVNTLPGQSKAKVRADGTVTAIVEQDALALLCTERDLRLKDVRVRRTRTCAPKAPAA